VSASHNPFADNGIKVFGADGFKLPDAIEQELEATLATEPHPRPCGAGVGRATAIDAAGDRYVEHLCKAVRVDLSGFRMIVDCANGAASEVGPRLLERCAAEVESIHASPDGININEACGATHPESLQAAVRRRGAHLGIALDGDADRLILVDETGAVVDGDEILAILAQDAVQRGVDCRAGVVATLMSNLGLEQALRGFGVNLVRCAVGDRYVVETMRQIGSRLGGEQSGHIILLDHATTGDGLLAALAVAAVMKRTGKRLSELRTVMRHCPQTLINVRVRERRDLESIDAVRRASRRAQESLAAEGRVLLRYSGTEPLVRVMVEGVDAQQVEAWAREIADAVRNSIGEKAG
jgi:phosphoglucosamine mutase